MAKQETDLRKLPRDKRPKPTSGQHAEERDLALDDMNDDEQEVIKLLNAKGEGRREARNVAYLAEGIDDDDAETKLRVRNAMRRLVSCGWVDRADRGSYMISERGRKRMQRASA